jgi:Flp pilus assembly protein TadD
MRSFAVLFVVFLSLSACSGYGRSDQASAQIAFGVDMARRGLWDEALFRFQAAERIDPQNPRVQSNIGVAYEASGQFDKALEAYQRALRLAPNDKEIRANYARFVEFYQGFRGEKSGAQAGAAKPPSGQGATGQPGTTAQPPAATPPEEPSTPEDSPPPPADSRPPL